MVGHLDLVKKLGVPKNSNAIWYAARNGYLDIVKYLVSINAPMDSAIPAAALSGYLDLVKYLVSIGAPINDRAITNAAENGYLDIVKYLVSVDAPISPPAIKYTVWYQYFKIVKYLLWNGAPYDIDVSSFKKELLEEHLPVISEFILIDITRIIFSYLCH